jgi:hypothetical protein
VSGDDDEPARNLLFRDDGGTAFVEVADKLGMVVLDADSRQQNWIDYDNDGLLDLFVATYGPTLLYRNQGGGKFRELAAEAGVQQRLHAVGASWGDVDNDGDLDLFVAAYVNGENWVSRAHLFMNQRGKFVDVLSENSPLQAVDHGVQWADFDRDGDLDLSLTDDFPENGHHALFRNDLPAELAGRSLQVLVLDREGRATRNGAEVRLYATDGKLLGTRLVPTGDGYGSQSVVPVHFGLANTEPVTVEGTFLTREGRKQKRFEGVDPPAWAGKALVVKAD